MHCQIVVIGAGAAGLLAAIRAAELGGEVLLLEKNRKCGVKILMSGGTRCNLTHATDRRGIALAYGKQGSFLHSALAALSPSDVVQLFEAEGVATKTEETGKIFPASDRALDVANALLQRLRRTSARLCTDEPVLNLQRHESGTFQITTSRQTLTADKLIVTTGGLSYPGCGTTGDGYAWAQAAGHTIASTHPALVPLTTSAAWIGQLSGLTVPDVQLKAIARSELPRLASGAKKLPWLDSRRGSLLFTHFGLSGPVALDISRVFSRTLQDRENQPPVALICDLMPELSEAEVEAQLSQTLATSGKRQISALLPSQFPRRLNETLLELAQIPADRKAAELSKAERQRLVAHWKRLQIDVTGTRGYKKAEVTAGGVSLNEVDSRTLQSKLTPGLYFAGEILDLDGPIGGFNFQAAFSTGWLAGQSAVDSERS